MKLTPNPVEVSHWTSTTLSHAWHREIHRAASEALGEAPEMISITLQIDGQVSQRSVLAVLTLWQRRVMAVSADKDGQGIYLLFTQPYFGNWRLEPNVAMISTDEEQAAYDGVTAGETGWLEELGITTVLQQLTAQPVAR